MRIFLTGATGYLGSAALHGFVRAGHDVTALVRTAPKAREVVEAGASALVGTLADPASYEEVAQGFDAYVHTARDHTANGIDIDRVTLQTLLQVSRVRQPRSQPPVLVYTSGVWILGPVHEPAGEEAAINPIALATFRPAHEQLVLEGHSDRLRTVVVRPGIVYGGSRGMIADILKDAGNGLIRVIGTGENHWSAIYDRDLAELFIRVVTTPEAHGVYHATDEAEESVNALVEAIASHVTPTPDVRHVPLAEARAKLGPYADALALDQRIRSPRARALGWTPMLGPASRSVARLLDEWRSNK